MLALIDAINIERQRKAPTFIPKDFGVTTPGGGFKLTV